MNAMSVKARLKNLAANDGSTMQDKLVAYALERSIYRRRYRRHSTIEGQILMILLHSMKNLQMTL